MLSNSEGSIHTPIKVRCARILHRKLLYKAGGALSALIHLGYVGMFLSAFLAATILPFSSEVVLSALYSSGLNGPLLLIVASVGNVLGSVINYVLGFRFGKEKMPDWISKLITGGQCKTLYVENIDLDLQPTDSEMIRKLCKLYSVSLVNVRVDSINDEKNVALGPW